MSPRRYRDQPARCTCQPGADAAKEHVRPGKTTADHFNAKCIHSELELTTRPLPRKRKVARIPFGP